MSIASSLRRRWGPLSQDCAIYGASLVFTLTIAWPSPFRSFRTWAYFAAPGYTLALLGTVVLGCWRAFRLGDVRRAASPRTPSDSARDRVWKARCAIALGCAATVCAAPLLLMAHARSTAAPGYVQSEVVVVESAAQGLAHDHNPYDMSFRSHELDGGKFATRDHFPYLPLMLLFGAPRLLLGSVMWGDARLWFALFAVVTAGFAVRRAQGSREGKLRTLQILILVPTGALALSCGGEDMPVLALGLASLVALDRNRPSLALLLAAGDCLLKLTALPYLASVAVAVASARTRRPLAIGAAPLAIVAAILIWIPGARADLLLYPLHWTSPESPARDITAGTFIIRALGLTTLPELASYLVLPVALCCFALIAVRRAVLGVRGPAVTASIMSCAWFCLLFAFAPAWRPGYVAYPVNALVWALTITKARSEERHAVASSRWRADATPNEAYLPLSEGDVVAKGEHG